MRSAACQEHNAVYATSEPHLHGNGWKASVFKDAYKICVPSGIPKFSEGVSLLSSPSTVRPHKMETKDKCKVQSTNTTVASLPDSPVCVT